MYFQLLRMVGASVGYMLKSPFVDLKKNSKIFKLNAKEMDATESIGSIFAVSFHGKLSRILERKTQYLVNTLYLLTSCNEEV